MNRGNYEKKFLYTHIQSGNCIELDNWPGYRLLNADPNYHLLSHNHGHWDFGYVPEITSHIVSERANLQNILKRLYISIPNHNFILFFG